MNNLDFSDRYDIDRFKKKCADQREIAKRWPAYDKNMVFVDEYHWKMGPWGLCFMLEIWSKPVWHGSAAVVEEIGTQTTPISFRKLSMANFAKVEIPQDALLAVASWEPEHFEQARFILAEVFGPLLRPGDDHQQALESLGLMAMQWILPYEGERFWLAQQH